MPQVRVKVPSRQWLMLTRKRVSISQAHQLQPAFWLVSKSGIVIAEENLTGGQIWHQQEASVKNTDSSKLRICNRAAAAKLASGVLSLEIARELLDVMTATPSAFVRMALCLLSGTALVSALTCRKTAGGQRGVAPAPEAVAETACSDTDTWQHEDRPESVSAAVIRRRVAGSSHRLWTRADGFTLSGARV